MSDYSIWTWDACRERFYNWGMQAEYILKEHPELAEVAGFKQSDQHFKNMMQHMLPIINALEENPDVRVGNKIAAHYGLHMGLHPDRNPSQFSVTVYWNSDNEKYHICIHAFDEKEEAYVSFVEAIPTIRRYLLRLYEIEIERQNKTN